MGSKDDNRTPGLASNILVPWGQPGCHILVFSPMPDYCTQLQTISDEFAKLLLIWEDLILGYFTLASKS